jgi:arylsulfatase A-like enzyme
MKSPIRLAPTILDLMGIAPPKNYQGRTMLSSALAGAIDGAPDRPPQQALFFADYSLGLLGLRDGRWKFIYEIGSGRMRLFDLERDPKETSDVSPRETGRTAWYSQVVRGWSTEQKRYLARAAIR